MSIRLAQASVLSGINSTLTNNILDTSYYRVSAKYIPTRTGSVTTYATSTTYSRPANVHFIDIALVGGGGSSAQTVSGPRRGAGGGGGAVVQVNQFYIGDYNTWYIFIGGNATGSVYGTDNCSGNSWGHAGNPTIFSPISNSFALANLTGIDPSNLRRTLIAPGGGGGGHPCGSAGSFGLGSAGGTGSNNANNTYGMVPYAIGEPTSGKVAWQAYGGRGGVSPTTGSPGGGGGGAGGTASSGTGGVGITLQSPFSAVCYGGGGAGGSGGVSGDCGGGNNAVGTNGRGGGGGASPTNFVGSRTGGTGVVLIREWFSS